MDSKLKHLEFIQAIITRMNSNSFLIKGWSITLISALFIVAAKDSNVNFIILTYFPIPLFWILDGFYLSQERKFRTLYNKVAETPPNNIDFKMDTTNKNNEWISAIFSKTLFPFYAVLIIITLILMSYIK